MSEESENIKGEDYSLKIGWPKQMRVSHQVGEEDYR